jgi:hypothetical protein
MIWRALAASIAFVAAFAATAPQRVLRSSDAAAADSASSFVADKGKFRILQNGSEVGTEEFELAPAGNGWMTRGATVIHMPGSGESHSSGQLRLAADGSPLHYDWTAQAQKKVSGTVDFEKGTAKTSVTVAGKDPVREDFHFNSPHIAVLDNNLYDQYAILARFYDWNAKGAQTFPVLIPQDRTPGTITVESVGPKTVDGTELETLRVRTADLEIELYLDAKHRLMRLEVPSAKVVIVRQ